MHRSQRNGSRKRSDSSGKTSSRASHGARLHVSRTEIGDGNEKKRSNIGITRSMPVHRREKPNGKPKGWNGFGSRIIWIAKLTPASKDDKAGTWITGQKRRVTRTKHSDASHSTFHLVKRINVQAAGHAWWLPCSAMATTGLMAGQEDGCDDYRPPSHRVRGNCRTSHRNTRARHDTRHPPHKQTGHVTASDQCCKTSESSC